ncbi:hypothetical protein [Vibrio sp. WXL103]
MTGHNELGSVYINHQIAKRILEESFYGAATAKVKKPSVLKRLFKKASK